MWSFRQNGVFERAVYSILCGIWVFAILPPIAQLGPIHGVSTFLIPVTFVLLGLCFPWWWTPILATLVGSIVYVDLYWRPPGMSFLQGMVEEPIRMASFIANLVHNAPFVDPLQTFSFIWLFSAVVVLVFYASRKTVLWVFYNVLGIGALAAIDSNTSVHPNVSIVVMTSVFLAVLGGNQYQRIRRMVTSESRAPLRFLTPILTLMLVSVVVPLLLPKSVAAWPDPFARHGSGTSQSIGYQLDDSRLGGSFVENDNQALTVFSPNPTYLRGQTLATYTGTGWQSVPLTNIQIVDAHLGQSLFNLTGQSFRNLPTETFRETIQLASNAVNTRDLLGGYAVANVLKLPGLYQKTFAVDKVQGNIQAPQLQAGQSYVVTTEELRDPYSVLAQNRVPYSDVATQLPTEVAQYDLQLPSTLPARVGELARQIVDTSHSQTEYQMVNALITYLENNYTYQTYDIPVPKPGQDYVDQFLFETKRGYCNNFSSSLAVMLRTLGVPTRWVTGYADGTQDLNYVGKVNKYVVTNNDAHSWVEVYFPQYGWIPFDPTPNFQIPFATAASTSTAPTPTTKPTTPVTPPKKTISPPLKVPNSPGHTAPVTTATKQGPPEYRLLFDVIGVAFILVVALLLVFRRRVTLMRLERLWQRDPKRALVLSHALLMKTLKRRYAVSSPLTLREFWPTANRLGIDSQSYQAFVLETERVLYGGEPLSPGKIDAIRQTTMAWLRLTIRRSRKREHFD